MLTTFSGQPVLSASAAFVTYVRSGREPDSDERSEAYLRPILLRLNRSVSPDEDRVVPSVRDGLLPGLQQPRTSCMRTY